MKHQPAGCRHGVALAALLGALPSPASALTEGFEPGPGDYVFYTFAITAIVFSALLVLAYRSREWLVYVGFAALLLLMGASFSGMVAYLVGPTDFVVWVVPYLIHGVATAFGYLVIAWRMDPDHELARLRTPCYWLAGISLLGPATSYFWLMKLPLDAMWIPQNVLFFVMMLGQCLPPFTWRNESALQRRVVQAFALVVCLGLVAAYMAHFTVLGLSQADQNVLNRLAMLVFIVFSLGLVVWQAFASARDRDAAERRALAAAAQEAALQARLARSERDFERAQAEAVRRQDQLATVSHDLRQPLSSMRLALDRLRRSHDDEYTRALIGAVDYVDQLARTYATETGIEGQTGTGTGDVDTTAEPIPTTLLGDSLAQMFGDEARRRGIELSVRCRDGTVSLPALAAMRIMSNLVANAVQHAGARRVLVALRPRGRGLRFEVHDDGTGMTEREVDRAFERGRKSAGSGGCGLGLAIVRELSTVHGFEVRMASRPGRGTRAVVDMPAGN